MAGLFRTVTGKQIIHHERTQQPGNEGTGWEALRALLRDYQGRELPRALTIFIGNVSAAKAGLRRLEGQPDYNRIWEPGDTPEHAMAAEVLAGELRLDLYRIDLSSVVSKYIGETEKNLRRCRKCITPNQETHSLLL